MTGILNPQHRIPSTASIGPVIAPIDPTLAPIWPTDHFQGCPPKHHFDCIIRQCQYAPPFPASMLQRWCSVQMFTQGLSIGWAQDTFLHAKSLPLWFSLTNFPFLLLPKKKIENYFTTSWMLLQGCVNPHVQTTYRLLPPSSHAPATPPKCSPGARTLP